ncbi:hypothetical protein KKA47_04720 [bacterium]|nr:hypothetical protein [bacterium]
MLVIPVVEQINKGLPSSEGGLSFEESKGFALVCNAVADGVSSFFEWAWEEGVRSAMRYSGPIGMFRFFGNASAFYK